MKYKLFLIFLLAFLVGFTFLYFEGTKIKYLSVFLPHREKHQVVNTGLDQNKNTTPIIYGVNVDMSQLVPGSSKYVVDSNGEDLIDIAKRLGVNLFRITSVSKSSNGSSLYSERQWDIVLNKMSENGIKALILVESPTLNPNDFGSTYLDLVKSYVLDSGALNNPDVYAVDIRNEPLLTNGNISAMAQAAKMIKYKYPQVKITIGGWRSYNPKGSANGDPFIWMDANAGKKLSEIVDFYSIHTYEYDKSFLGVYPDGYNLTEYSINKVLPILNDKPILIEEFGAGNGEAITDQQTLGSPQLQANAYDGAYQAIIDYHPQGILGSVAFLLIQRDNPAEAGWALIKDKGNFLFPAAYVLQKYAKGTTGVALNLPYEKIPNDYLLTNEDNNKTINVKIGDIIGLRLNLSKQYSNSVKVGGNSSILLKSESLIRENNGDYIDATFHVVKSGKATIKIIGSSSSDVVTRFSVNVNAGD